MTKLPKPPLAYDEFIKKFPKLGQAWELLADGGQIGPLDERTQRLIKFALAVGAQKEGAAHASVRKAMSLGITEAELEQVIALAAGTLGLPAAVAAHTWMKDVKRKD
jgi:4-carboxymuconolactone decarboxylase